MSREFAVLCLVLCWTCSAAYYIISPYRAVLDDDYLPAAFRVASYGYTPTSYGGYPSYASSWQYNRKNQGMMRMPLNYGMNSIIGGRYYIEDMKKKKKK